VAQVFLSQPSLGHHFTQVSDQAHNVLFGDGMCVHLGKPAITFPSHTLVKAMMKRW